MCMYSVVHTSLLVVSIETVLVEVCCIMEDAKHMYCLTAWKVIEDKGIRDYDVLNRS